MKQNYRFPKNQWLRYQHQTEFVSGQDYLLVVGSIYLGNPLKPMDFALRAVPARDGLEAFCITEDSLRKKKTDRDLHWTVTDEGNGQVSLFSVSAKKYLNLDDQGARLSKKKQALTVKRNGSMFRFFAEQDGKEWYLYAARREETNSKLSFTSGNTSDKTSFGLLQRTTVNIPLKPTSAPILTAGTYADVHIDYGLQMQAPYIRKSIYTVARRYRQKYDLDAIIMCGDNISDNATPETQTGASQGFWPYKRWQRSRARLDEALRKSFRTPEKSENILYLTGNHDYQVGDRQPEGLTYNSAYYTDLLPKNITHALYQTMPVDQGPSENLLCYQYRIKNVHFLVLNEPAFPFTPKGRYPSRGDPGHSLEQAVWLEERLNAIEAELGDKAVIFVSSHFPFTRDSFYTTYGACHPNGEAFYKMMKAMLRFPNLFYIYGHVHCADFWVTLTHSAETVDSVSPIEMNLVDNGEYLNLVTPENSERSKFRSDVILSNGFHHVFGGSLSFCGNRYFSNDGKHLPAGLTADDVPFLQVMVAEVYDDRVVLTMENFGTKKDTLKYLPNATYKLKPLVCPLVK